MIIFIPPRAPDVGTAPVIQARVRQFGDGLHSAPDGINHIRREMTAKWSALSLEHARAIEDFMEARGGYQRFRYALPDDIERKWVCRQWKTRPTPNGLWEVTAALKETFGHG